MKVTPTWSIPTPEPQRRGYVGARVTSVPLRLSARDTTALVPTEQCADNMTVVPHTSTRHRCMTKHTPAHRSTRSSTALSSSRAMSVPLSNSSPPGYASGMRTTVTRWPLPPQSAVTGRRLFNRALPRAGRHNHTSRSAAEWALRSLLAMSVHKHAHARFRSTARHG